MAQPDFDSRITKRLPSTPRRWLLLRGLGRERRHWFDFPDVLAAGLRVQSRAVDLPGMGDRQREPAPCSIVATARDVRQFLAEPTPLEPWGVIGISLGGMVALALASEWPAGVSHVVVINASARCSRAPLRLRPAALAPLARAALEGDARERELGIYALTTNATRTRVSEWAARAAALGSETRPGGASLVRQLWAATFFQLAPVGQPVLVLSGGKDRLVASACSQALAHELGATFRCHPTAGHDLPLEEPDWVIAQLRSWLESPVARGD